MKNFAITGAAGYVAPRHLKAIRDTGNQLLAAMDPSDSVGILDTYFPDSAFFTEYERFDRHLEKLKRRSDEERVHFLSICSPNHLHDAHIRTALRTGADALCEKPLVLNPWNLDSLAELEQETGCSVWTVLQLRVHPELVKLKQQLESGPGNVRHKVILTYITARGKWYLRSWKGVIEKSGGVATNIGVHFFDMMNWLFGPLDHLEIHVSSPHTCSGILELKRAEVQWFLSTDLKYVPVNRLAQDKRTFRSIVVDGNEVEFSDGFTDLHTEIYRRTLAGEGFRIDDTRNAIEIIHRIRGASISEVKPNSHPFINRRLKD